MLDQLFDITESLNYEEYGSMQIIGMDLSQDAINVFLDVWPGEESHQSSKQTWQVVCSDPREHRLSLGTCSNLSLNQEHVLLWPYTAPKTSTSFHGLAKDPLAVVGALYQRHVELVKSWFPFQRFFNMNPVELISAGYGMLAEGPLPLLEGYTQVLNEFGLNAGMAEPRPVAHWNGERWVPETNNLSVLLLDDSYVVSPSFEANRL